LGTSDFRKSLLQVAITAFLEKHPGGCAASSQWNLSQAHETCGQTTGRIANLSALVLILNPIKAMTGLHGITTTLNWR
tara:strand:- start:3519 stop:3752 length:234 start_codon:yes stop_codon:yes gene_type:complete